MKSRSKSLGTKTIDSYIKKVGRSLGPIARRLRTEIESLLPRSTSKLYHGMPVWFIGENAVVGFGLTAKRNIKLLFWNGQAFGEPALRAVGSFEAAQMEYKSLSEIKPGELRRWIRKSGKLIWDFAAIRKG